jgi:inorganic pyrophosphatase
MRASFVRPRAQYNAYKDLERGKWVRVGGWVGPEAKQEILAGVAGHRNAAPKPAF